MLDVAMSMLLCVRLTPLFTGSPASHIPTMHEPVIVCFPASCNVLCPQRMTYRHVYVHMFQLHCIEMNQEFHIFTHVHVSLCSTCLLNDKSLANNSGRGDRGNMFVGINPLINACTLS